MWELRRDPEALAWLEAHYADYSDRCLACRLHTKIQTIKDFGRTHPKSERHVREECERVQKLRWRRAEGLPPEPRLCPFAAFFKKNVGVPLYEVEICRI